jgi:hypothetical protein
MTTNGSLGYCGTADPLTGFGEVLGLAGCSAQNNVFARGNAQLSMSAHPRYGWTVDAGWAQREAGEPSANDERLARFRRQWSVLARLGIVE